MSWLEPASLQAVFNVWVLWKMTLICFLWLRIYVIKLDTIEIEEILNLVVIVPIS